MMKNRSTARRIIRGFVVLTLLMLFGTFPSEVYARNSDPLSADVDRAFLVEDWERVVSLLISVDQPKLSPIERLVKGHACLATNRNNESLCLFLSVKEDGDLAQWKSWCERLVKESKGAPVAYYALGDACSRLGDWNEALKAFDAALGKKPGWPLTLNAMGVVHAKRDEVAAARVYFTEAIGLSKGRLADAFANAGFLWIQKRENAEAAIEAFDRALAVSPDFALAYQGRGCVKLLLPENKAEAGKDMKLAAEKSACAHKFLDENLVRYAARVNRLDPEEVIASLGAPGTTFRTTYDAEKVGGAAARDFALADTFRKVGLGPVGDFFGNRGVEKMETIQKYGGDTGIQKWSQQYSNLSSTAQFDLARVEKYNAAAKPIEQSVSDVGKQLIGPGVVLAAGGQGLGAGLIAGGTAGVVAGNVTQNWSNTHTESIPKIRSTMDSTLTNNPSSSTLGLGPGGADSAMPNWIDGQWPFKPSYGIAYP